MSQKRALMVVGLLLAAAPAVAEEEYTWKPFVAATYVSPMDSTRARVGDQIGTLELSSESGWEAGLEWRFARSWGIEAAYGHSKHDIEFRGEKLGDATYEPIYVALDLHIYAKDQFDFWAAPTVVFTNWKEDGLKRGVEEGDTSDTGFGVTLGADWMLGDTWALTGGLRYVNAQIGLGPKGKVAVDPLTVRFGVAAKF